MFEDVLQPLDGLDDELDGPCSAKPKNGQLLAPDGANLIPSAMPDDWQYWETAETRVSRSPGTEISDSDATPDSVDIAMALDWMDHARGKRHMASCACNRCRYCRAAIRAAAAGSKCKCLECVSCRAQRQIRKGRL